MERFHRRILFGTDNWELGLSEFLDRLTLDQGIMEQIMYKNAARITGSYS